MTQRNGLGWRLIRAGIVFAVLAGLATRAVPGQAMPAPLDVRVLLGATLCHGDDNAPTQPQSAQHCPVCPLCQPQTHADTPLPGRAAPGPAPAMAWVAALFHHLSQPAWRSARGIRAWPRGPPVSV